MPWHELPANCLYSAEAVIFAGHFCQRRVYLLQTAAQPDQWSHHQNLQLMLFLNAVWLWSDAVLSLKCQQHSFFQGHSSQPDSLCWQPVDTAERPFSRL